MQSVRRLARHHHALTGALIALALAMKLLVPAGFMPTFASGRMVITICTGAGPTTMAVTVPGMDHGKPGDGDHGKTGQPCAFAGVTASCLGAADPLLLALAILFVMALVLRPTARRIAAAPPYLRPPLRGPPASL